MLLQVFARVVLALADLLAVVGIPGAGFVDELVGDAEFDDFPLVRDALAVEDVEEGFLERRRDLVLDDLDLGFVADDLVALLDRADAADVLPGLPLTIFVCASGKQPLPCQITDSNQDDAVAIKTECGVVGQQSEGLGKRLRY